MLSPDSTVPQTLASYTFGMVPVGYEAYKGDPSTQVGTGCLHPEELHPRPGERARAQPELLAW